MLWSEYGTAKSVGRAVGDCLSFIERAVGKNGKDRPENLFLSDFHIRLHIDENDRPDEVAFVFSGGLRHLARNYFSAFGKSRFDVALHALKLPEGDHGPHPGRKIPRVADGVVFERFNEERLRVPKHFFGDEKSRERRAGLPGIEKARIEELLRGRPVVGHAGQPHAGRFAAQFERNALQIPGSNRADPAAHPGRARKGHHVDAGVRDERFTHGFASPLNEVEDPRRKSRLAEGFGEKRRRKGRQFARLQSHRAAHQNRGHRLLNNLSEGIVPGRDGRNNPHGLPRYEG